MESTKSHPSGSADPLATPFHKERPGTASSDGVATESIEFKKQHPFQYRWRESLWPESLAVAGGICCFAGMVTVLITMDNKPFQSWLGGHALIQLSTTISTLATALKVLVSLAVTGCISQLKWLHFRKPQKMYDLNLYDAASRGPGGSLRFLFTGHTVISIASVGAIITLFLLPLDPFTQQLVKPVVLLAANSSSEASFGYTRIYDNSGQFDPASSDLELHSSDTDMQGAIFGGLYNLNHNPPFNCESANCAWPDEYTTLGFDSVCKNVTTQVKRTCREVDTSDAETACNYVTPSNMTVITTSVPTDYETLVAINSTTHLEFGDRNDPLHMSTPVSPVIVTFAIYRNPYVHPALSQSPAAETLWEMTECSIELVSHKYANVSVQGNIFSIGEKTTTWLKAGNVTDVSGAIFGFISQDESSTFQVRLADWDILAIFLQGTVFNGAIYIGEGTPKDSASIAPAALARANISEVVGNIAAAMTNRLASSQNSTQAKGQVLQNESFVTVQWPFLILHVVILIMATVFLILTNLRVNASRGRMWKDSNVALICHQVLDWDGQEEMRNSPSILEERSKHIHIQLSKDVGFQACKTGDEPRKSSYKMLLRDTEQA